MDNTGRRVDTLLGAIVFVLMIVSLYAVFLLVPTERTMGLVQRIFYFHVAAAWVSFLAFFLVFVSSIAFLMTRRAHWDRFAACCAELGLVFIAINLTTGPIWARPVWGIWWTWDARLTSALVLGLIYLGYLMLRAYVLDPERRANLSAVVGIMGFIDVPIVYMSIRWWRTQHPQPVVLGGDGSGLAPEMWAVLMLCFATLVLFFIWLMRFRLRLEAMREELDFYRQRVFALRSER